MNPFTIIECKTVLEERNAEELEIQPAKSGTEEIFILRCLTNNTLANQI